MHCRSCGSTKVESDPSSGTVCCIECGEVLEENAIVAEIGFQEVSGGKTIIQGSFAGESGRLATSGPYGRGRGKEGQEQAMDNGRQKIARLAHGLKLPERYRESAQRYYNLAVVHRFTRGRKTEHVAAVCLYIVCRNEESSQMLIDFSDLLQTNVFVLGATFLKLVRILCIKLPLIDPSIYISRFAAALDFGEYTQRVAQDAVRLVQRMDRDWIRTGRRPAGICGACLLIAARINGFSRTTREMIYIVKVAEITINNRLREFKSTESANLSVRDFRTMWLETEADPPAFTKGRLEQQKEEARKRKRNRELGIEPEAETANHEVRGTAEDTNEASTAATKRKKPRVISHVDDGQVAIPTDAHAQPDTQATLVASSQLSTTTSSAIPSDIDTQATLVSSTSIRKSSMTGEDTTHLLPDELSANPGLDQQAKELEDEMTEWMKDDSFIKASESLVDERMAEKGQLNDGLSESLSDVDDEEIDAMLLEPAEVQMKAAVWYTANKDYLEAVKAKARQMELDRINGIFSKKKGHKKKKGAPAATPAEAAKQLVQSKRLSKKINQAVFDDMFESPESIARIKEQDMLKRSDYSAYEVVEESGDGASPKKSIQNQEEEEEDEDDEDMDPEDMADDERLMMEARRALRWDDNGDDDDEMGWDD